jgi:hypothetical protein
MKLPSSEPGETAEQYRLRVMELRIIRIEEACEGFGRLRRDVWIGIACILIILAWTNPGVWAPVLAWGANGYQMLKS